MKTETYYVVQDEHGFFVECTYPETWTNKAALARRYNFRDSAEALATTFPGSVVRALTLTVT